MVNNLLNKISTIDGMANAATKLLNSADNDTRELAGTLTGLGVTTTQALVYIALLKYGPQQIVALANKLELPRTEMYHQIAALGNLGIVKTGLGFPAACAALEPEEAVNTLLSLKRAEISECEAEKASLVEGLNRVLSLRRVQEDERALLHLTQISGRRRINNKVSVMLRNVREPLCVLADDQQLKVMSNYGIFDGVRRLAEDGLHVKLLVNSPDARVFNYLYKNYDPIEVRLPARVFDSWFVMESHRQMVMSAIPHAPSDISGSRDLAIHTNAKLILETQLQLFELLWESATQLVGNGKKISVQSKR